MVNDVSHSSKKLVQRLQGSRSLGRDSVWLELRPQGAVERHEARKHSREPTMNGDFIPESSENE